MRDTDVCYDEQNTSRSVDAAADGSPTATSAPAPTPARDDKGKDVSFDADSDDETLQVDYRNVDLEKGDKDYEADDSNVNQRLLSAGGPSTSASASDSENDSGRSPPVGGRGKKNKKQSKDKKPKKNETVRWRDLPEKGQLTVLTLARLSEPLVQTSLQVSTALSTLDFRYGTTILMHPVLHVLPAPIVPSRLAVFDHCEPVRYPSRQFHSRPVSDSHGLGPTGRFTPIWPQEGAYDWFGRNKYVFVNLGHIYPVFLSLD